MNETNDKPLVSVVMPAYNAEKYISTAVNSILNQTYSNFELIIVNDCSTDNTKNIISEFASKDSRVKILTNETNLKAAASLNNGIQVAKGKYIARMDADDWSFPNRLEKQIEFLEKNPNIVLLGASMQICDENLEPQSVRNYPKTDKEIRNVLFRFNPFCSPVTVIKKSILDKTGLFNTTYPPVEDYELFLRIGLYGQIANLPDILLKYRVNSNSLTQSKTRNMELMTFKTRKLYYFKYKLGIIDVIWNVIQFSTIFIIPAKLRMKLFFLFRDNKIK